MDSYLQLSSEDQRAYCEEAAAKRGLPAASIEKDFWVCWTLRELVNLPEWGENLSFKGGTSLSKGWQIIERFSEDIDLVIDRRWLGFTDEEPGSKKLTRLQDECQRKIQDELLPLLTEKFEEKLSIGWKLRPAEPSEGDAQTLIFEYPGVMQGEINYLRRFVKIELGARSDTEPSDMRPIRPFLNEVFPEILGNEEFYVRTVAPKRTFWEKALLLHEENSRPERPIRDRLSRHYYDLWSMSEKGIAEEAIADLELFQRVVDHRKIFFKIGSVDYETMVQGRLKICPPTERRGPWAKDYDDMQAEMFYGEPPSFDQVLARIAEIEAKFNRGGNL